MSEILAFSENKTTDTTLSSIPEPEPESASEPGAASADSDFSAESKVDSEAVQSNKESDFQTDDFAFDDMDDSENASSSQQNPFTGDDKASHQRRFFHTAKELNYLREKYILEKIPDDQLLEYLKLEEKRHELQVQERNIREKRIMNTVMLIAILVAIVTVVYCLHENPTVLISILYIGGILAAVQFWNKKK